MSYSIKYHRGDYFFEDTGFTSLLQAFGYAMHKEAKGYHIDSITREA